MVGEIIPEILGFELASFLDKKIQMCLGTEYGFWLGWGHLPSEAKASKPYIYKFKN